MSELLMCGPVEMAWREKTPLGVKGAFTAPLHRHVLYVWKDGVHEWRGALWVFGGMMGSQRGHDTPEAAAEDLARFLGEMAEALEPWRKNDD